MSRDHRRLVSDALRERDAVERWLREKGGATYGAMRAQPQQAISAQAMARRMRARPVARLKRGA